jgi:hypothetical protein
MTFGLMAPTARAKADSTNNYGFTLVVIIAATNKN